MVHPGSDRREVSASTQCYRAYLESVRAQLPADVYEFAVAEWKFDFRDHRCLHDAWVERVIVSEHANAGEEQDRQTEILVHLRGAFHDGHTALTYRGVSNYELRLRGASDERLARGTRRHENHGDWLVDEIRLGTARSVIHEILLSSGATWLIGFRSFEYATTIPAVKS